MKNEILSYINRNHSDLLRLINKIDQEDINRIPFEGSWTAGQLLRHIIKSNSGFVSLMNGPVKDLEEVEQENGQPRKQDDKVEIIESTFSNFELKTKSPDFVVPEEMQYEKETLLNSLVKINNDLNAAILVRQLDKLCIGFEIPVLGYLTRLESLSFVISHTRRHIRQLKNILHKQGIDTEI